MKIKIIPKCKACEFYKFEGKKERKRHYCCAFEECRTVKSNELQTSPKWCHKREEGKEIMNIIKVMEYPPGTKFGTNINDKITLILEQEGDGKYLKKENDPRKIFLDDIVINAKYWIKF